MATEPARSRALIHQPPQAAVTLRSNNLQAMKDRLALIVDIASNTHNERISMMEGLAEIYMLYKEVEYLMLSDDVTEVTPPSTTADRVTLAGNRRIP